MSQVSHIDADVDNSQKSDTGRKQKQFLVTVKKYADWIAGAGIFIVAAIFSFYRLGAPSIWFDEAFSVELSRHPFPFIWHLITGPEPNMALYYILLHFWLQLTSLFGFHQTEFIVRFPSALSASICAVVVYLLARRVLGRIGGGLAALLLILNDLQLTYAQQTRSYALQSLLLCLAFFALIQALLAQKHQKRWWIVYTLANVLAIYAHLFSFLVLLAQGVAIAGILIVPNAWRTPARQQLKAMLLSAITVGICSIPMIILSRQGSKTGGWLPIPHLRDIPSFMLSFAGNYKLNLYCMVFCICVGILIAFISYVLQYLPQLRQRLIQPNSFVNEVFSQQQLLPWIWLVFCWLVVPLIASFIISQGPTRLFSTRYLMVIIPALVLLVATGVVALRQRIVQIVLIVGLLILAGRTVPTYYKSAQVEDWNSSSAWLTQHYQPGDGLVCYDNVQGCQIAMEYYLHAYPDKGADFSPDTPGYFSWEKYNYSDAPQALDTQKLAVYGAKHPHLFFIAARLSSDQAVAQVQQTEHWLDTHFHYSTQIVTRTVTIRLYDTSTHP